MPYSFNIDEDLMNAVSDLDNSGLEGIGEEIDIEQIVPSPYNPIPLYNKEKEQELVDSIQATGVRNPVLVRIRDDGMYELIDGHNRVNCAKIAGMITIPAIIRDYSDEDARFINLDAIVQQRGFDDLKPSLRAKVIYSLANEIDKERLSPEIRQSIVEQEQREETNQGINERTKRRYLRLYKCCDAIKEKVDDKDMTMEIALELADLTHEYQELVLSISEETKIPLDTKKAKLLKEKNKKRELNESVIREIFDGKKRRSRDSKQFSVKLPSEIKVNYFTNKSAKEIQTILIEALQQYFENNKNGISSPES